MELAFEAVRNNGGLCILAGNLPAGEHIFIDPFNLIRGKRIIGTWGGETHPDRDIPFYTEAFIKGRLPLSALITHEFSLEEVNFAFDELERGRLGRGLVNMSLGQPLEAK